MNLVLSDQAWGDLYHWIDKDLRIAKRIGKLINDIKRNPFEGIGKPEPLKYDFAGYWSRRINEEHRLIYKVEKGHIFIAQLRYHYS